MDRVASSVDWTCKRNSQFLDEVRLVLIYLELFDYYVLVVLIHNIPSGICAVESCVTISIRDEC